MFLVIIYALQFEFFSVKTRVLKSEKLFHHIVILVALTLRHSHFGSKMAGQYSAESLRDYYVKDGIQASTWGFT